MFAWLKDILLFKSDKTLSVLLVILVALLFVVYPFVDVGGLGKYVIEVGLSLLLISGVFVVEQKNFRRIALGLMVVTLATRWASYAAPSWDLLFVNTALGIVFFGFAIFVILGRVFAEGPVTAHRVQGAVAVYLLIGLVFASIYALILQIDHDAFRMGELIVSGNPREIYEYAMARFTYFSFITLTTVGYGDVTPVHPVAKQFAVLEGLIGQLYPAILLARLVSLQISTRNE